MMLASLALLCLLPTGVLAPLPIPPKRQGFPYKDCKPTAQVQWEVFLDINCPDSAVVFPTILSVADHFLSQDRLCLIIYNFPLPYHPHAYNGAQGSFLVNSTTNVEGVYRWFEVVFEHLVGFKDIMNIYQAVQKYSELAEIEFGIPQEQFQQRVLFNTDLKYMARMDFKYGASRGVAAAPTFFVNGVNNGADETWTLLMWTTLFDTLLTTSEQWVRVQPTRPKLQEL